MVDEHDASEVAHTLAADELGSMRRRHDELVRRLDSVSPRAPLRVEPGLDASCEAVPLDVQPEAEDTSASMAEQGERTSMWSPTQKEFEARPAQRLMIAREAEEDTNAVVSPTHSDFLLTSIAAKVQAIPFMWAFNAFVGVGLLVSFNTYSTEHKTWLKHVFDICQPVGAAVGLVGCGIAVGRVTAVSGHLASLGAGETKISERSYRGLRRSHALMVVPCVLFTMLALVCFVTATRVGTRSKLTGHVITESYAVAVLFGGIGFLIMAVTAWPLWLTLKMASVLVADAVSETRQKIERCTPASAEWELEVMPSVLGLCTKTLPLLSKGWGTPVATSFLACWLGALAQFAAFLETGAKASALMMVLCALTPVAIAYDAASASSDCDGISDVLNYKRMNGPKTDIMHEHALCQVERILDRQNTQQGLGFMVREGVVDLKTLFTIMAGMCGVLTIACPILFSLRPGGVWDGATMALFCTNHSSSA